MELTVSRLFAGSDSTVGVLSVDEKPFCFTVEDEKREVKVPGETAIPEGRYEIKFRDEGGMTKRYRAKFPELHRGMLWLQDVPGFEWVYIHIGNTDDHTEGCILVNYNAMLDPIHGGGTGGNSTNAYKALYQKIVNAVDRGEQVFIRVIDET